MNAPRHYRFLIDYVEEQAKNTYSILFRDTETFWDDLLEAWDRKDERPSYWLFGTRWMRERLIDITSQGSPRALVAILLALQPQALYSASWSRDQVEESDKRRLVATLLPILMREVVQRVRNRSELRFGDSFVDDVNLHPEDH